MSVSVAFVLTPFLRESFLIAMSVVVAFTPMPLMLERFLIAMSVAMAFAPTPPLWEKLLIVMSVAVAFAPLPPREEVFDYDEYGCSFFPNASSMGEIFYCNKCGLDFAHTYGSENLVKHSSTFL